MSLLKDKIELEIQQAEFEAQTLLGGLPKFFRILITILLLGLIPAYYGAKALGYKIWDLRLKQGAIVAKPSFFSAKDPEVSNVTLTFMGSGNYGAVVLVKNPNLDLSADKLAYKFVFYNSQKQQLYSYPGQTFLLANSSKYIIAPRFNAGEEPIYADFAFSEKIKWQKRLNVPDINFKLSAPVLKQNYSPLAFAVSGNLTNNSPYLIKKVSLTFVLLDRQGQIVGESLRDEFTVKPLEQRSYTQLWPNMWGDNVAEAKVSAETDSLDSANISIISSGGPASDLSR